MELKFDKLIVVPSPAAGLWFIVNHGLAADLMTELREHARQVLLQNRERDELRAAGRPLYELPMITDEIDLAGLYQLAGALRRQGAA